MGRKHELDKLEEVWDSVSRGERQAVFVAGEPGSGKTNLAAVTAQALHSQGAAVLFGASSPDLDYPYKPLVEALEQLLMATEPGELDHILPDTAAELLRITPRVRRHRPTLSAPPQHEKEYRRELFDAYVDLMAAAARERPLALILEDLHWSSAPTRLLLSHLIQSTDREPLLVFCTLRSTAPDRSDELAFTIADLYRLPGVHRLDLAGLTLPDIEDFVSLAGHGERAHIRETAALLMHQTGGNPFFLRELWRDITRSGGLRALKTGDFAAPTSVRDTIERRIRNFGEADHDAIELAAVVGDQFELSVIVEASEHGRESVLTALDRACEYGLVLRGSDAGAYSFQHALVRQAVLDRLSPSRSALLHAALAVVMESQFESRPQLAPLLARLYGGARPLGYEDKTVEYLAEAARQAERGLAHEEAATLWETAARMLKGNNEQRDMMLMAAARSLMQAADFSDARRLYTELSESLDPTTALGAAIGHEEASWRPGLDGGESLEMLTAALRRVEPNVSDPVYIRALSAMSRAHAFAGDLAAARPLASHALELARRLGDDGTLADVLVPTLFNGLSPDLVMVNYAHAKELQEIALRIKNYDALGPAAVFLNLLSYTTGRRSEWDAAFEDLKLTAAKTGQPFWQWMTGCCEFIRVFLLAEFAEAHATAERLLQLGYDFGSDDTEGPYGIQMYMVQRETAQLEQVRPLISGDAAKDGTWQPGLLALYTELGFEESAHDILWQLIETIDDHQKNAATWPVVLVFMVEAALELDDETAIRAVLPLVYEYEGFNLASGPTIAAFGSCHRYLGQIHARLGEVNRADEHFTRALAMDTEIGSVVHQAETMARYSLFLAESGRSAQAVSYHEKAVRLAKPRGHHRVLRILDRRVRTEGAPGGLTPREREVLRLIADGASNKEIGDRLYISQNTAANHVRNILIKTMTSNRTQAAIYAAEHGLLG